MSDERGGRYFREARFFLAGDRTVAQSHILEARQLMGYMRDQLAMGGPPIQVQYAQLQDGTLIKATMMNGQYQAEIVSVVTKQAHPIVTRYEVLVHPAWSTSYDWVVVDQNGCIVHSETRNPIAYSNRLWQASDLSIYAIINGREQDKYFGVPGDTVAKDGLVLAYYGAGVVGVAEFMGRLVVVQQTGVANVASPIRDQKIYKVFVDGVEKLTTAVIDAYVDGGYSVLHDQFTPAYGVDRKFSQTTVMFNQDGSEGASVLGNAAVIKFSLADDAGDTVVSYAIEAIPSAQATYHEYTFTQVDVEYLCSTNYPAQPPDVSRTYDNVQRVCDLRAYDVALACDYGIVDGVETLIYCMLHDTTGDDVTYSQVGARTETGGSWTPLGPYYTHNLVDTAPYVTTHSASVPLKLYFSTGEVVFQWSAIKLRNTVEDSWHSAWEDVNIAESVHLLGLDIKNRFAVLHTTKADTQSAGQTVYTYEYNVGHTAGTIYQAATYHEDVFSSGWGEFFGGFDPSFSTLSVEHGPAKVSTDVSDPTTIYDSFGVVYDCETTGTLTPNVPYSEHLLTVTTDNAATRTDERARYPLLTTEYPYYDTRLYDCFGMPFPNNKDEWDRALVFLRVPTFPEDYVTSTAEAHAVCLDGSANITAEFVDGTHPTDGEPITRRSGVIRNVQTRYIEDDKE